jgi:salicylate hydroxylase
MAQRILIVGAGIGGLHAAAALARRGCAVTVLERAPALGEVGAGVQISPNAARLLERVGALAPLRAEAVAPPVAEMRDGATGAVILRLPLGPAAEARWGAPYLNVHRADLAAALAQAAQAAGAALRFGAEAATVEDGAVTLAGGERLTADAVIGADGVRSTVRAALFGAEAPRFTGSVAWRATVPAAAVDTNLVPQGAVVWVGPGRHLVTYRLRAGRLINLVAVEERAAWTAEGWSEPGDPAALRAAFRGWRMAPLLAAVEGCFLWGLFDRPPTPAWSRGRVGLIGDACHPMPPFMAQGAGQAIEDGAALARLLPGAADVPAALAALHAARAARTARVQATARANARLYHARSLPERLARQGFVAAGSRLAPSVAAGRLDWLYGWIEPAPGP